jgi:hypothetical protein
MKAGVKSDTFTIIPPYISHIFNRMIHNIISKILDFGWTPPSTVFRYGENFLATEMIHAYEKTSECCWESYQTKYVGCFDDNTIFHIQN